MATFGLSGGSGGGFPGSGDRCVVSRYLCSTSGTITSISGWLGTDTATGCNYKLVVLNDAAGAPGTFLTSTAGAATPSGGGAVSGSASGSVVGGNYYWLGFVADDFQATYGQDTSGGSAEMANGTFSYSSPPSWPGTDASYSINMYVLVTYTEGSGDSTRDESFTLTDAQTVQAVFGATRGESVALSHTQVAQAVFNSTRAESVAMSDTQTVAAVYPVSRAESVALSDAQTGDVVTQSSRDEAFTLSDAQSAQVDWAASRAESVALSDAQTATGAFGHTRAEAFALSDSQTANLTISASRAESFILADAQSAEIANNTVAESFVLTDSQSATGVFNVTRAESFSLLDAYLTDSPAGVSVGQGNLGFDPSKWEGKQRPRAKLRRAIRQELEAQFNPAPDTPALVVAEEIEDLVPAVIAKYNVVEPTRFVAESLQAVVAQVVAEQKAAKIRKRAVQLRQQQFILKFFNGD